MRTIDKAREIVENAAYASGEQCKADLAIFDAIVEFDHDKRRLFSWHLIDVSKGICGEKEAWVVVTDMIEDGFLKVNYVFEDAQYVKHAVDVSTVRKWKRGEAFRHPITRRVIEDPSDGLFKQIEITEIIRDLLRKNKNR
ncbi:hypothetical protein [Halioglobus sp. HI00S01]|uniref:hypothetical protein n=1 Tax=Halioglobus sp. HI00S01 TaxID=1822214 RepID=UPI0012E715D9|nr:hypothetical protein [Halioglobus sp. HI00S01]